MNHRALARAFRRIVASTLAVPGGALLVSCGGSVTNTPSTGARNDGADGSGTGPANALPGQGVADAADATLVGGDAGQLPE